jgi:hypothetical protein
LFTQILFETITAVKLAPQPTTASTPQTLSDSEQADAVQAAISQTTLNQNMPDSLSKKIDMLNKKSVAEPSTRPAGRSKLKTFYFYVILPITIIVCISLFLIAYCAWSAANGVTSFASNTWFTLLSMLGGPGTTMATFSQRNLNDVKTWPQAMVASATVLGIAGMTIFSPFATIVTSIGSWFVAGGAVAYSANAIANRRR